MGFGSLVTKPYHWAKSGVKTTTHVVSGIPDVAAGALDIGEDIGGALLQGGEQLWNTVVGGGGSFFRYIEYAAIAGVAVGGFLIVNRLRKAVTE